ncbi:UNVERIFIED_CONTAM: hypothetical protein HDU68_005145 [Siphonaria sp. JEL0065]|nr:hypothetical protein HDU68_005145 [Siphonaria sp. JEL0065]
MQSSLLVFIAALVIQTYAVPLAASPSPSPTPGPMSPSQFLNLGYNWYVQLPVSTTPNSNVYGSSSNPGLRTFTSPNFYINSTKNGVVLYTNNTGITTGGSDHPRTELREMCGPTGLLGTGWPSNDTVTRQLNVTMKVDAVPLNRLTVIAQVFAVTEGAQYTYRAGSSLGKYYVALCTKSGCFTYDSNYILGTPFSLNISSFNGQVTTTYKNWASGIAYKHTTPLPYFPDYVFKTGNYCQIVKGTDDASAYCQVTFSAVSVTPC